MRVPALLLTLTAAMLTAVTPALAELGPIRLVSKDSEEQAQEASATAISGNGRYLAFQGAIGGLRGVFREDLETGGLTAVEVGNAYEKAALGADASAPSISADGRYVSFTTSAPLDPVDDTQPTSKDVYVADMSTLPPTYELASALDGSSQGLTYEEVGGSEASGRVALSADGRRVVFSTTAPSDLTSGPGGSTPGEPTPAGQIVLRDLDTKRTTLVSVSRNPASGAMTELPVPGGARIPTDPKRPLSGAAISGDGTTVSWLGTHLPAQVPLLNDEREAITKLDPGELPYDEPLWRRVADGPSTPTRRMVGGGDPLAPGCPPDGTLADPPCQGPFPKMINKSPYAAAQGWLGRVAVDGTPQLSFDGRTAAVIGSPNEATNVFLVDMGAGLSRDQAVHQLTRQTTVRSDIAEEAFWINREPYIPLNGDIFSVALSADGNRIAFATARQQFPLAPPSLITPPPASLGVVELYLISRDDETLQRVTHGVGGEAEASQGGPGVGGGGGVSSPSLDTDGHAIGFASTASNLVAGDGNDAADAFVVDDPQEPAATGSQEIPPPARKIRTRRHWRFTLSASSLPNGAVRLVAVVPGRGRLRATASASLSPGRQPRLLARAALQTKLREGGPVKLDLKLAPRLRNLARTTEGVYATASVGFRTSRGKTLHGRLQVRFHRHPAKHGGRR